MNTRLGMLFALSAAVVVPAAAQDANSLLQAAGTGTIRYVGQSYDPNGDWPRAPLTAG